MRHTFIILFFGLFSKFSFSQSGLSFGKYEGIEVRYFKSGADTSDNIDIKNKIWGTKKLIVDSNGTFTMAFPVPWPTTIIGLERFTSGTWIKHHDTLILNSYYGHRDFMKVKESKRDSKQLQLKINYESGGKKYFPHLEITINKKTLGIKRPLTEFPLDTVNAIEIKHYAGPNSSDNEWFYKPINCKSNFFEIWLTDKIKGNNFVLENYRLLIRESSLIQIDNIFYLLDNRYKR